MRTLFLRRTRGAGTPVPARRPTTPAPRWVKVAVGLILLLVLLFIILHLTGNGFGEHMYMERGRYPL